MGNGAFKSRHGQIRIMETDGDFLEFERPVEVSEVMMRYPNHMVVHCFPKDGNSTDATGRSRITIMHPDQELEPGEDYILHLVPPQYRKVVFKTLSQPSPHVVKKKQPKYRVLRLLSRQHLTAFFPKHSRRTGRGKHGKSESSLSDLMDQETQPQVCIYMGWQPSLECIPECSPEEETE
ncbi:hypothetical protein Mapa_002336 [Marchantia paleacea]|nr:hypothetical protein Mapa_002336 [Marchantia paleacea]